MEEKNVLQDKDMEKVSGGTKFAELPNPVNVLTEEEARLIAAELGDGKDMGLWKTMSGEQYMQWWRSFHEK